MSEASRAEADALQDAMQMAKSLVAEHALDRLDQTIAALRAVEDAATLAAPSDHAQYWARLADCLYLKGRQDVALDVLEAACAAYETATRLDPDATRRLKVSLNWCLALDRRGFISGQASFYEESAKLHAAIITQCDAEAEPLLWLEAQMALGGSEIRRGRRYAAADLLAAAVGRFDAAASFCEKNELVERRVMALHNAGMARKALGEHLADVERLDEAVADYERALRVAEAHQTQSWSARRVAELLVGLGNALSQLGEFRRDRDAVWRAVACYEREIEIRDKAASPYEWAGSQMNRALALQHLGEWAEDVETMRRAIDGYSAAIEVFERARTPVDWAMAHMNRGNAWRSLDELGEDPEAWPRAMADYDEALATYRSVAVPLSLGKTLCNRGVALRMRAARMADAALAREAIAGFEEAETLFDRDVNPQLWGGAQLFLSQANRLLADLDQDAPDALVNARAHGARAAETLHKDVSPTAWASALWHAARTEARRGAWPETQRLCERVFEHMAEVVAAGRNRLEQQETLTRLRGCADLLAFAHVRQGAPRQAFDAAARGRAALLATELALVQASGEIDGKVQRLRRARAEWLSAHRRFEAEHRADAAPAERYDPADAAARRAERDAARAARDTALERLRTEIAEVQPASPQGAAEYAAAALAADEALALPVITDVGGVVLMLDGGSDGAVRAIEAPALTTAAVDTLLLGRSALEPSHDPALKALLGWRPAYLCFRRAGLYPSNRALNAWNAAIGETLDALWPLVMGPIDDALTGAGRAIARVVLAAPGRLAVLPLAAARRRRADGAYESFLERWAVSLAPTPFALHKGGPPAESSLLAVNPLTPHADDDPAWAQFPSEARTALCGAEARLDALTPDRMKVGYLSYFCHGVWDPDDPERSGLNLADGERLTLERIRGQDYSETRLISLIACESGLIDTRRAPDEFSGLPAAFLGGGAMGVAATLWPVDEPTSARLTARFFAEHLAGAPPAEALRRAQLALIKGEPAPFALRERARSEASPALLGLGGALGAEEEDAAALPPNAPFFWAGLALYGR